MLKHVVLSLHDFYTGEASTIPELLPTCTRFKRALTKEKWEDMSYPDSFAIETLDKVCESVATHLARRIRSGDHCEDMFSGVTVDCARLAPQFAIAATKANRFMKRATKTAQKGTDFKDSFLHLSAATEAAEKLQEQVGKVSDEHLREKAHPCTGPMLCPSVGQYIIPDNPPPRNHSHEFSHVFAAVRPLPLSMRVFDVLFFSLMQRRLLCCLFISYVWLCCFVVCNILI